MWAFRREISLVQVGSHPWRYRSKGSGDLRLGKKALLVLATMGLGTVLWGCDATYLIKQGYYQVELLAQRRPVESVLEDESLPEELKRKIRLVAAVCSFAEKDLNLDCGDSYSTYIPVKREALGYSVIACPKDSLSPVTWRFPLVGSFPYKGFFQLEDALEEATELENANYDVYIGRISDYSALGWFSDPIYSTMLMLDETELIYTIFHELVHKTVFFKDRGEFNEQIATFIGWKATLLFCERNHGQGAESCGKIIRTIEAEKALSELLQRAKEELEAAYGSSSSFWEKLTTKEKIFSNLKAETRNLGRIYREGRFRSLEAMDWNNASFLAMWLYRYDVGDLEALWEELDENLISVIETLKSWKEKKLDPLQEIRRGKVKRYE